MPDKHGWISVEERLPEGGGEWLTWHPRWGRMVFDDDPAFWNVAIRPGSEVTHWQPLPDPPEEPKR